MAMTRAELARCLHGVAIFLENESDFYASYTRRAPGWSPSDRRGKIADYVKAHGGRDMKDVLDRDFMQVNGEVFMSREYVRRYLDMTWGIPRAPGAADDHRASLPDFEFWLDAEQWPDQIRAGEPRPSTQPQPQPTQDITMLAITTKTLINGVDIADKTNDQLFDAIAQAEAEIAKLQAISAKPKALVAKINELQAGIAALVAHMDSKV